MGKVSKHKKRIRLTYAASSFLICLLVLFAYSYDDFVNRYNGYYIVTLNGVELGTTNDPDAASDALKSARLKLSAEADGLCYIESDLDISPQEHMAHLLESSEEMEELMYDILADSKAQTTGTSQGYIVNIDGYTVTLSGMDAVTEMLEEVKNEYDTEDEYEIVFEESSSGHFNTWTVGTERRDGADDAELADAGFAEDIKVIEAFVSAESIVDAGEAAALVTEEKPTKASYEVVEGDTLSEIAQDYDMTLSELLSFNSHLTEESVIYVEDNIIVTVPEPELSIVTVETESYTEKYSADVEYIEDDDMFEGETEVVSKGSKGKRKVTVEVEYTNGVETDRTIIEEEVIKEAVAKVVKVGTQALPTYIRPITGGTTSSYFGYRTAPTAGASTYHKGIDWAVPIGTAVRASCSGTVTYAGWSNGYGYNVVLSHADGNQTRYAHLSSILVSVGDKVTQGERIALSGNSGRSTGAHLHFEVIVNGTQVDPLDYVSEY